MPLSDHVATHSFPPKKDEARQTTPPRFDPPPKNIYFGLEVIIAMVEGALTRAQLKAKGQELKAEVLP